MACSGFNAILGKIKKSGQSYTVTGNDSDLCEIIRHVRQ